MHRKIKTNIRSNLNSAKSDNRWLLKPRSAWHSFVVSSVMCFAWRKRWNCSYKVIYCLCKFEMSLFLRRSLSESSETLQRSPSLASIREGGSADSWSTHEGADDRDERVVGKREYTQSRSARNLINSCDDVSENVLEIICLQSSFDCAARRA